MRKNGARRRIGQLNVSRKAHIAPETDSELSNIQGACIRVWFIKICSQGGGSHMFKVRTVSRFALFFLVTALAS
jgi:hypothetical protein